MRTVPLVLLMLCLACAAGVAAEPIVIPVVTDPSPVIDGNLQE